MVEGKPLTNLYQHILENILPNALMIGVPYDLFWSLNPKSLKPFIRAFVLKQQYDDTIAWQQGFYNRNAIVSAMNKSAKYPTRPIFTTENKQEVKTDIIKERFLRHAKMMNIKLGKGELNDGL